MSTPPPTTGQRIKDLRRAAGMSQADLATAMGRSESWVSQVERGVQPVERLAILQGLADALGVSVREIRPDASPSLAAPVDETAEPESNDLDGLRVALTGHPALGSLFDHAPTSPAPTLAEFRDLVDQAWEYVHASSFAALSDHLAKLLPEIEVAVRHAPHGRSRRVALAQGTQLPGSRRELYPAGPGGRRMGSRGPRLAGCRDGRPTARGGGQPLSHGSRVHAATAHGPGRASREVGGRRLGPTGREPRLPTRGTVAPRRHEPCAGRDQRTRGQPV